MTKRKWHYCGDINLEYGGTFYRMEDILAWDNDDVTVVDVTSGEDIGKVHGSREYWMVDEGLVYVPRVRGEISDTGNTSIVEKYNHACKSMGYKLRPNLDLEVGQDTVYGYDSLEWRMLIVEALKGYNGMDRDQFKIVTNDAELWGKVPEESRNDSWYRLRAGASLENWVKKHVLRGLA